MRILASLLTLASLIALTATLRPTHAQDTPWNRRLRKGVLLNDSPAVRSTGRKGPLKADELRRLGLRPRGNGLVNLSYWPEEPAAPARVVTGDLAVAMAQLCPASSEAKQLERYAEAIIRYSQEFSVDPWLLAALVYTQSGCRHEAYNSYGTGLTLLNVGASALGPVTLAVAQGQVGSYPPAILVLALIPVAALLFSLTRPFSDDPESAGEPAG